MAADLFLLFFFYFCTFFTQFSQSLSFYFTPCLYENVCIELCSSLSKSYLILKKLNILLNDRLGVKSGRNVRTNRGIKNFFVVVP